MIFALHSLFLGFIIFFLARYTRGPFSKTTFYLTIAYKIILGFVAGYFYLVYGDGGDTYALFRAAIQFNNSIEGFEGLVRSWFEGSLPWYYGEGRIDAFVKLISPLVYFSQGNYWITGMYLSVISFCGYWFLVLHLSRRFPEMKWMILYSFFLLPSVSLWSSGIFKESLSNPAIMVASGCLLIMEKKLEWKPLLAFAICMVILLQIKFYLFITFSLAALVFGIFTWIKNNIERALAVVLLGILAFTGLQLFHPWLAPEQLPQTFYDNYSSILENSSNPANKAPLPLEPTYTSMILSAPLAFVNATIRPLFFTSSGYLLEMNLTNLLILFTLILTLVHPSRIHFSPLLVAVLVFIIASALLFGLTTPNFGSLYRYRSAYLPFLIFISSIIPFKKYLSGIFKN